MRFRWPLLSILTLLLLSGCNGKIKHVIFSEQITENGFEVNLGYQYNTNMILAKVTRTWVLKENDVVTRQAKVSYWEWFEMGQLPKKQKNPWSNEDWAKVQQHAGKKFYMMDMVRMTTGKVSLPNPPDNFKVIMKAEHELYTGGKIHNPNNGSAQAVGRIGYFASDPQGNSPTATTQKGSDPPQDDSQDWMNAHSAQGQVLKPGKKRLTMIFTHESGWALNQPPQVDWSVDFKYERDIEGDKRKKEDGVGEAEPREGL